MACAIGRGQRWRKPRYARPHPGSGSGRGSTTSSFCQEERADASHPRRQHRVVRQIDSPAEASLSATGQAGSHSGRRQLHALISKEGTIEGLKVVSGHPLLVPSALEAVKQWAYQPTVLNGEPVEVETDIDVNFTLSQ